MKRLKSFISPWLLLLIFSCFMVIFFQNTRSFSEEGIGGIEIVLKSSIHMTKSYAETEDYTDSILYCHRARARGSINLDIYTIDSDNLNSVKFHLSVRNDLGDPIKNLTESNITLTEDGVPVTLDITQIKVSGEGLSAVLVIDCSGSMGIALETAKEAAIDFVNGMGVLDRIAIVRYSSYGDTKLQCAFTSDKQELINYINNVGDSAGATALYKGT